MSFKNISTKKQLITSDYFNWHTGESLSSEMPGTTSVNVRDENFVIIDYTEFIILDSQALRYIQSIFNNADLEKILRMTDMVKGTHNILHGQNGKPHNPQSLRLNWKCDESEFSKFMKRLHSKSIIYYIEGFKEGRKCKWIMLNPTLARKSKKFHKDCSSVFDDLSQKHNKLSTLLHAKSPRRESKLSSV